jgi:hypothetical protein
MPYFSALCQEKCVFSIYRLMYDGTIGSKCGAYKFSAVMPIGVLIYESYIVKKQLNGKERVRNLEIPTVVWLVWSRCID